MKKSLQILLLLIIFNGTLSAQLSTMRAIGPSGLYESTYNHFRDTTVYYPNGSVKYIIQIVDSTKGIYTDYKEKSGRLITKLEYKILKDTFLFTRVEIWSKKYLKSVATFNEDATEFSAVYYFDESDQIWLMFSHLSYKLEYEHSGYIGEYKEYYKNGNLRLEGEYKNGCRVGQWRSYHENGKLESLGNYVASYTSLQCPLYTDGKVHYIFSNSRTKDTLEFIEDGDGWNGNREMKDKYEMERDGVQSCSGHFYYHRHGWWDYYNDKGEITYNRKWKFGEVKRVRKYRIKNK